MEWEFSRRDRLQHGRLVNTILTDTLPPIRRQQCFLIKGSIPCIQKLAHLILSIFIFPMKFPSIFFSKTIRCLFPANFLVQSMLKEVMSEERERDTTFYFAITYTHCHLSSSSQVSWWGLRGLLWPTFLCNSSSC